MGNAGTGAPNSSNVQLKLWFDCPVRRLEHLNMNAEPWRQGVTKPPFRGAGKAPWRYYPIETFPVTPIPARSGLGNTWRVLHLRPIPYFLIRY
jgi:hypothetical protein